MSIPARSLLGLSILETNLENNKSKEEELKEIIKKQNRVLKGILNERKSENEDKIPDDSKVKEALASSNQLLSKKHEAVEALTSQ